MKILRVIASMDPVSGGPGQGIRNSIPELEKQGIYNEVVSLDDPKSCFLARDPFVTHALGTGIRPWCYNARLLPWLLQHLERFDAVIVHGLWLYPSYAVHKAVNKIKANKPRVYIMPHGMLDPYFQQASGRRLKALRNWLYWKLIEGKVVNNSNGVIFTCQQELLLARKPFRPYKPKQEINTGYGIATPPPPGKQMKEAFLEKCPEVRNQPYFLFLSRIHEKKGADLLISAYLKMEQTSLAPLPCLIIAGPGLETSYGRKLQHQVLSNAKLKNKIFFPGMLSGEAKWGAFYGCEAFLLPSHQENFGIAVAEAMACGKPLLISDKVNIWRELYACGGGLIMDDTKEGIIKILKMWNSMSAIDKRRMGRQAFKCFKENFSSKDSARRLSESILA